MTLLPPNCSEREPDGSWEDCTWCTGVDLENFRRRAAGLALVSTSRSEYEALRVAGGDGPAEHSGDGSNYEQLAFGIHARYGWSPTVRTALSFDEAWSLFPPGAGMGWQGSMGSIAAPFRRWDPGFTGAHSAFAVRVDGQDRAWWMNPQAPATFAGEWISKPELRAFYDGLGRPSIITEAAMVAINDETPKVITTHAAATWYDLDGRTPVATNRPALGARPSPYGVVGFKRAMYATIGGNRRLVLVVPATIAPVPAPVTDCAPTVARAVNGALDGIAADTLASVARRRL